MNVELTQGSFPFTWLTFSKKDRILSLILCRRLRFYCWQNTGTLDLDTFRLLWYHCTSVVFKFVCYDWLFLLLLMVKIMFSLSINEWPECMMYFVFWFSFFCLTGFPYTGTSNFQVSWPKYISIPQWKEVFKVQQRIWCLQRQTVWVWYFILSKVKAITI